MSKCFQRGMTLAVAALGMFLAGWFGWHAVFSGVQARWIGTVGTVGMVVWGYIYGHFDGKTGVWEKEGE